MAPLTDTDLLLVQRAGASYKATFSGIKADLLNSYIIHSDTPPTPVTHPGMGNGTIWVDTSKKPPVSAIWDEDKGDWESVGSGGGGGGGSIDVPPANVPGSVIITENTTFRSDTQKIEFQLATANADTDPWHNTLAAAGGVFVRVRWKLNAFDGAAQGSTVTETAHMDLQFGGTKSSVYTWNIDKIPAGFTLSPATDVVFPAPVACGDTVTVTQINAPARIWANTDGGSTEASVAGAAWVTLTSDPATTPAQVSNGQTVQFRHTTQNGALLVTTSTFYIGWDLGACEQADFVTTNVDSGVVKPTFTAPANNATGIALSPTLVGNAYVAIGAGGTHLNTDWEIASDAGFTTIVSQSLADATNKTSWTASGLASATFYFARFRYRGSGGVVSDWSDVITFETSHFLPPLVNGTETISDTSKTWTVPGLIGTLKVEAWGGGGSTAGYGAYGSVTFDVTPGEVFRIDRFMKEGWSMDGGNARAHFGGSALAFGPDGGSTHTQATLWLIAGAGGGNAGSNNNSSTAGGNAGWAAGQAGNATGANGGGGTQSAGGAAGAMGWDGSDIPAQPGTALLGGQGYYQPNGRGGTSTVDGGSGGSGWFGGGGGGHAGNPGGAGGGASSKLQVPAGRNPRNVVNQDGGTSTYAGGGRIVLTW